MHLSRAAFRRPSAEIKYRKTSFSVLGNPPTHNQAVPITESPFYYASGEAMSVADSRNVWKRYGTPVAAHVLWQGVLKLLVPGDAKVDEGMKDRAPPLLLAGTKDRLIPAAVAMK